MLADARFFGFAGPAEADNEIQALLQRLAAGFAQQTSELPQEWREWLGERVEGQRRVLAS